MSAADAQLARARRSPRGAQRFGRIVVVGGGCYGSYYVRQLARARAAGAVTWQRLTVVDRDARCRVATESPEVEVVAAEWSEFFDVFLGDAADGVGGLAGAGAPDTIVPSPLMPHLMFEWLVARARARWPGRAVGTRPLGTAPPTPWERAGANDAHYVSFATWMCPVNCVEPARCPETRGPRDWSVPVALAAYAGAERAAGRPVAGPAVMHCVHRAYGVGMFDVAAVLAADELVRSAATGGAADVLVATASHCHGAVNVLAVGPATPDAP